MTHASRQLEPGAHVSTTYDHGRESLHVITARRVDAHCQSGVMFKVLPDLGGWIDADWFQLAKGYEHTSHDPETEMDPFAAFGDDA
jgi:hypothetical protein